MHKHDKNNEIGHRANGKAKTNGSSTIFFPNGVEKVDFIAGAANYSQLPSLLLPEIAFLGRSNVGKSSMINVMLGRKNIAKTSRTPGRTQQINLFRIHNAFILADLPGYGYAKIAKSTMHQIQELVCLYLQKRSSLIRLMLLIDARRGITDMDEEIMQFLCQIPTSFQLVFTKIDKIKKSEIPNLHEHWLEKTRKYSACHPSNLAVSSLDKTGINELRKEVDDMMRMSNTSFRTQ